MSTVRNAFTAFGAPAEAATIDTLRTDLALALRKFIERSQMGQAKVGEILGLKQNVVSQIVRGKIEHLSVERLIKAMVRAKIPGYAEWGASAEDACARVAMRASPADLVSVAQTPTIGSFYEENWLGGDSSVISEEPLFRFASRTRVG
jgi:predicted XRE-type DNA-binding protein